MPPLCPCDRRLPRGHPAIDGMRSLPGAGDRVISTHHRIAITGASLPYERAADHLCHLRIMAGAIMQSMPSAVGPMIFRRIAPVHRYDYTLPDIRNGHDIPTTAVTAPSSNSSGTTKFHARQEGGSSLSDPPACDVVMEMEGRSPSRWRPWHVARRYAWGRTGANVFRDVISISIMPCCSLFWRLQEGKANEFVAWQIMEAGAAIADPAMRPVSTGHKWHDLCLLRHGKILLQCRVLSFFAVHWASIFPVSASLDFLSCLR